MAKGNARRKERVYAKKKQGLSAGVMFSAILGVIIVGSVLTYLPTEKEPEKEQAAQPKAEDPLAKALGITSAEAAPTVLSDTEIAKILETKAFVRLFITPFSAETEAARATLNAFAQEFPLQVEEINMLQHCGKASASPLKGHCPPAVPGYIIYGKGRMPMVLGPTPAERLKSLILGNFIVRAKYFDGDCPLCPQQLAGMRKEFESKNAIAFEAMSPEEANQSGAYPVFVPVQEDLVVPEYKLFVEDIFPRTHNGTIYLNGALFANPSALFTESCGGEKVNLKYFSSKEASSLGFSACANGTVLGQRENCNFTAGMDSVVEQLETDLGPKLDVERYCIGKGCDGNATLANRAKAEYNVQVLPALVFDCKYRKYGLAGLEPDVELAKKIICNLTAC